MSVWKETLSKRFWFKVLLMVLLLAVLDGVAALVMSGGLVDHHMTLQGACAAWGIAALLVGGFAARGKGAILTERLLVSIVAFVLVLLASLMLGGESFEGGVWWKCGLFGVGGAVAAGVIAPKKRKKKAVGGVNGKIKKRR